ncbi:MAG: rhodanese-like domain-containing protein [Bdellovibrionaceae bacterium]|nr:rhodanese-like domain-containing protein [Pseudobdellovibrionaceae bacterium]
MGSVYRMPPNRLYDVWSCEPESVCILDFRGRSEFERFRIPGSVHCSDCAKSLEDYICPEKIVVLIEPPSEELDVLSHREKNDVAILEGGLESWESCGYPVEGFSETQISKEGRVMVVNKGLIFHQLFEPVSCTYTYLLADAETKEAVIIDPVLETAERDLKLIEELGLKLNYILETHIHADHITSADKLRRQTGAKTVVSKMANVDCADVLIEDNQEIRFGRHTIRALATPGHTNSCMSYYTNGMVFTGDALLIRGCGRTDFQQGNAETLYNSVHKKIFALPDETLVYPGHDYKGFSHSTILEEKQHNPRLGGGKTLQEFKKIMSELKLDYPKKIDQALPANMACGKVGKILTFKPRIVDGIPEVSCEELNTKLGGGQFKIVDVRGPDEFNGELGHIPGAQLVVLGPDLLAWLEAQDKDQEIVFVCRSGRRSANATMAAMNMGFKNVINLTGGMLRWNELAFRVSRE